MTSPASPASPLEAVPAVALDEKEEECWENQRFRPFHGWTSSHENRATFPGTPALPSQWSNDDGTVVCWRESWLHPPGWAWRGPWQVKPPTEHVPPLVAVGEKEKNDMAGASSSSSCDKTAFNDGWQYGTNFGSLVRNGRAVRSRQCAVRRRRWVRTREQLCLPTQPPALNPVSSRDAHEAGGVQGVSGDDFAARVSASALATRYHRTTHEGRALWLDTHFLGCYPAATQKELAAEQTRQHCAFHSLYRHCKSLIAPFVVAAEDELEEREDEEEEEEKEDDGNDEREEEPSPLCNGGGGTNRNTRTVGSVAAERVSTDTSFITTSSLTSCDVSTSSTVRSSIRRLRGAASKARHVSVTPKVLRDVYAYGLPNALRPVLWLEWSGARDDLKCCSSALSSVRSGGEEDLYRVLTTTAPSAVAEDVAHCMEMDAVRIAPRHPFFTLHLGTEDGAIAELLRVLIAVEATPDLPRYHQGASCLVAALLLHLSEREAYWLARALQTRVLPPHYLEEGGGMEVDLQLFAELIARDVPAVHQCCQRGQIDLVMIATSWWQALFCAHFPLCTAARLLDVLIAEADGTFLVRFTLAVVRRFERAWLSMEDAAAAGMFANAWAKNCYDVEDLVRDTAKDGYQCYLQRRRAELALQAAQ